MDLISGILIFMAIMAAATALFGGWSILLVGRGVRRLFGFGGGGSRGRNEQLSVRVCPRSTCRAINPGAARFCRRCGEPLSIDRRLDSSGRDDA